MPLLNGKTPEEVAADVMDQLEDQLVTVDGMRSTELDSIARYINRDSIQLRGEKFWEKNKDRLRTETINKLISLKFESITNYITKRERDAKMEYFLLLRSKGMSVEDAEKESGIAQAS